MQWIERTENNNNSKNENNRRGSSYLGVMEKKGSLDVGLFKKVGMEKRGSLGVGL